jgi:hypothetical protein
VNQLCSKDVIGLMAEGVEAARVAEAVTQAWERAFNTVRNDAGFREAVYLLMQIAEAIGHCNHAGRVAATRGRRRRRRRA